jgi:hypothetical protein
VGLPACCTEFVAKTSDRFGARALITGVAARLHRKCASGTIASLDSVADSL